MKIMLLMAPLVALCLSAAAQEVADSPERLDSAVVSTSRAGNRTPVTFSSLTQDQLQATNPSFSLPMALQLLPSVVCYNEGGTGLGNSTMTIRGSKGSQINVTLNGISLNDAESQEVFWVNIPSLQSLLSHVQVQRGLGTSMSGAGTFGASINMNTAFVAPDPTASLEVSYGSYGTAISTVSASSGLLPGGLYATAAYSRGTTEGYIRNAFVRSQSAFVALGWLGGNSSLRFTYLMGQQRSGITWNGISLEQFAEDPRYNDAGEYTDEYGNVHYYDNQTDNYAQHHFQLNYTQGFGEKLLWTTTLNYTRGEGYDEYYKTRRRFANFGFPEPWPESKSDMIYQKKSSADNAVFHSNLRYKTRTFQLTGGVDLALYKGLHWGEALWAQLLPKDYDYSQVNWYVNQGTKQEGSAFLRAEYAPLSWLTAYADLQLRAVHYLLQGEDDDFHEYGSRPEDRLDYSTTWPFFNPRAGVTVMQGPHKLYLSAALGHREPGRSDIKENIKGNGRGIAPEKMLDIELGYQLSGEKASASANLYLMEYWDMLLETGRLSSSGYAIKENMPRAWRRGLELTAAWTPWSWMTLDGNLTLSTNRIADYTAFVPYDDYSGRTFQVAYGQTTMLLSPSTVGMARLQLRPEKQTLVILDGKYVGKQYLDNSCRDELSVPAYFVSTLSLQRTFPVGAGTLLVAAYVNNLFNHSYYASGWRWESYSEETETIYTGVGVYPQATRNFCLKVKLSF